MTPVAWVSRSTAKKKERKRLLLLLLLERVRKLLWLLARQQPLLLGGAWFERGPPLSSPSALPAAGVNGPVAAAAAAAFGGAGFVSPPPRFSLDGPATLALPPRQPPLRLLDVELPFRHPAHFSKRTAPFRRRGDRPREFDECFVCHAGRDFVLTAPCSFLYCRLGRVANIRTPRQPKLHRRWCFLQPRFECECG